MSVIAQSYLIPLISGRHGRPATKLLSQENNKIFSSKLNVLQLKSRTFCVVHYVYTYLYFTLTKKQIGWEFNIFFVYRLFFALMSRYIKKKEKFNSFLVSTRYSTIKPDLVSAKSVDLPEQSVFN